jgi:hypothetical protein
MKERFLPYFILLCAVGLSATAAYYSVIGLSVLFASVAIPVIIMGSFLEISKIAIATYLHDKWKETYTMLKVYLTVALVVLSFITSLGIYGLLSNGFQENITKMEIGDKQIKNIEVKKSRFEEIKQELTTEKQTLNKDISQLRNALSTNTTTQSVDRKTGQITTRANEGNRKAFENQLNSAIGNKNEVSKKINALNDSLTNLEIQILDMRSKAELGNELGAIKYVSEMTGKPIKEVANIFILLLIFVFDPLAITLIIATNQAFKQTKNEPKPQDTPEQEHQPDPAVDEEIRAVEDEIQRTSQSGASHRKMADALSGLHDRLFNLRKKKDDDNVKTY